MRLSTNFTCIIDRSRKEPIFEQICEASRALVHTGTLEAGSVMPPTRALAEELGVSRSTVVTAYEQLEAEGYIEGHKGAGFIVCSIGNIEITDVMISDSGFDDEPIQALRALTPGHPDMTLFPYRQFGKAVSRVCRLNPESMLIGADRFGNLSLRNSIVKHVMEWRGVEVSPQQVIVTSGATEALNLCIRTFTGAGHTIGIENPGYKPILKFIKSLGIEPTFLSIDKNGATLPKAKSNPTLVVLTPSHQYPLGGSMSLQRRMEFIKWANINNSWLIEDDYDSEFRYSGRPTPAMTAIDQSNRTLYIGSFSKIFSDSLRLGYLIVPISLVEPIRKTMDKFGLKAGLMPQQAISDFMNSGNYYRHLRRIRKIYNERRVFLVNKLQEDFSNFGYVQDHPAGMQLVFHLNQDIKDVDISRKMRIAGVELEALSESDMTGKSYNGFILGFCNYTISDIQCSLKNIHQVLSSH